MSSITQRGIGNGMSLLIFASVVSRLPANFGAVRAENGTIVMIGIILLFTAVMVAIVFMEQGQRRIPVQFAKRVVGRRMYGGQSTYIPLKVNSSGVIPIIFASSVLYLPIILSQVLPVEEPVGDQPGNWAYSVQRFIDTHFVRGHEPLLPRDLRAPDHRVRVLLHGDPVRPAPAGRPDPQAGRLHPRHPARSADRALPRQDPEPDHAAGRAVHRRRWR